MNLLNKTKRIFFEKLFDKAKSILGDKHDENHRYHQKAYIQFNYDCEPFIHTNFTYKSSSGTFNHSCNICKADVHLSKPIFQSILFKIIIETDKSTINVRIVDWGPPNY